jgi:hypothetical protein
VFAGTLELEQASLSSDPRLESPVLEFSRIDVARLTLPAGRAQGAKVETSWPIVGTYYLDPSVLPFQLASREDLVKGQIWLPAGTRVSADQRRGGSARVERPPALPGRPRSTPVFSRSLPCGSLVLAGGSRFEAEAVPSDSEFWRYEGTVSLSAAPGSTPFGSLALGPKGASFRLLEEREGWAHIAGVADDDRDWYVPYAFDAWTRTASSGEHEGYVVGGVWVDSPEPTHVTSSAVRLFAAALENEPIAVLPPDVTFSVDGEKSNGFVELYVPYVRGAKARPLWASERELAANARPLAAP